MNGQPNDEPGEEKPPRGRETQADMASVCNHQVQIRLGLWGGDARSGPTHRRQIMHPSTQSFWDKPETESQFLMPNQPRLLTHQ